MTEPLITFADAAELVGPGVTARTLRPWHEQGRLEAQRVGRQWRTTAGKVREAIEKGWPGSSSTARIESTGPAPSLGCGGISGTSPGTKDDGVASVARAASLATELARKERLRNIPSLGSTLMLDGQVVPYSRQK